MGYIRDVAMMAAGIAALGLATTAHGAIIGVQWKNAGENTWELYAEMHEGFRLTNADLGDEILDEAPAGVNHGLFVSDGTIESVSLFIGNTSAFEARTRSLTGVDSGQKLDAAWFIFGGEFAETVENTTGGTIQGVKVLTVEISPGARLGGLGPDGSTQSRIFLFANDGTASGTGFGVFDVPGVPAPGSAAVGVCALGLLGVRRRR